MIMLTLGGLLIGVAALLDSFFRFRIQNIGDKSALLQGGAFDYSRYHRLRKQQGWAAWPVYVITRHEFSPMTRALSVAVVGPRRTAITEYR